MNGKDRVEALKALILGVLAIIVVGTLALGGIGWWLNENFGSTATLVIVCVFLAATCLVVGMMLNQRNTRKTLEIASEFHADIMNTQTSAQRAHVEELRAYRELLKGESAQLAAQARVSVIDHQAVEREVQRRMQALLIAQRQQPQLTGPAQDQSGVWVIENETTNAFQYYE